MLSWLVSPTDPAAALPSLLPGVRRGSAPQPGGSGWTTLGPTPPRRAQGAVIVNITLLEVSVADRKPSGQPWDVALFGPVAPDPAVTYRQLGIRDTVIFAAGDTHRAIANVPLPHPVELTNTNPAQFVVFDRDVAAHDLVGMATLRPADVRNGGELTLPVIDHNGRRSGNVRLRVQMLQRR